MTFPMPAGWYPDPSDPTLVRWYDGQQWTENTQSAAPIPAAKKKSYAAHFVVLVLAIAVIGLILSSIAWPSSSTSTTSSNTEEHLDTSKDDPTLLDPTTYEIVTERDLAVILRNPWDQVGRRILVHGTVRQFDTATGDAQFLADIGTSPSGLGNTESASIIGDPNQLDPFVEGDNVAMFVVVDGQWSYTSTADIEITVPQFRAGIIKMNSEG